MKKVLLSLILLVGMTAFAQETIILQPGPEDGIDAFIYDYEPNRNLGTHVNIIAQAGTQGGKNKYVRSLLKFKLDTLPPTAIINSASISLYCYDTPGNGVHDLRSGSNASYMKRIIEPWDEETVTWSNQPLTSDSLQVYLESSKTDTQNYTNVDVTQLTQFFHKNPHANHGVLFRLLEEDIYSKILFGSSDCPILELRPELIIHYSLPVNNTPVAYDTILIYDTITVYDTVKVYQSICDTLVIDITTKLHTPDKSISSIMIYPNPTTGTVNIKNFNFSAISNYSIRIVSAQSQTIFESQINQELFSIDLSQFSNSGLYFIQIFDDNFQLIESKKILLK